MEIGKTITNVQEISLSPEYRRAEKILDSTMKKRKGHKFEKVKTNALRGLRWRKKNRPKTKSMPRCMTEK